jgi:uncharacterized protein
VSASRSKKSRRPGVCGDGRTPLHHAVIEGDSGLLRSLLEVGADANASDHAGWTPLHFAAQSHDLNAVRLLLDRGARPNAKNAHGNTPLFVAVMNSRGRGEAIAALRAAGADPRMENADGVSALSLARTIANFDIRRFFENCDGSDGA